MVSISQETMANVVGEKGILSKTMSTILASLSSKAVPRANIRTYYPKKSIKKHFDYFTDDVKEGLIQKFPVLPKRDRVLIKAGQNRRGRDCKILGAR